MANAVSLFTQGNVALPDYLREVELDDTTKKLAGSGGGLRISIKGGVWRLMNGGEEISRNEDRAMNMVIVASSPDVARTYYEGTYEEGQSVPPTCWSNDDKTPDASVPEENRQAPTCATCPQNIAGSGQNGSRACRYSRRLAVTLENDPNGGVYQVQLPAQSIFGKAEADGKMPLQAYAKLLVQHKLPINAVVTEFRFDTNSATPKITFKPVRPLSHAEFLKAKEAGQSPEAMEAIRFTVFQTDSKEKKAESAAGIFEQPTTPEQAAAVQQPAAEAPPKRTRAKAKTEPAPQAAANPQGETLAEQVGSKAYAQMVAQTPLPEDDEEAELLRKLEEKRKARAAAQAEEPRVVQQQQAPAAQPAGVASMLDEWDDPA